MKVKVAPIILTLLASSSFAQSECPQLSDDQQVLEAAKKLNLQRDILRLYQKGVLTKDSNGDIVLSEEGQKLIDELKAKGLFEVIQTNGDHICI